MPKRPQRPVVQISNVDCKACLNGTKEKVGVYTAFGRKCLFCGRHLPSK
jgi:hypothetical protein